MRCLTKHASFGRHAQLGVVAVVLAIMPRAARAQARGVGQGGAPPATPVTPANDPTPGPVNVIHRSAPSSAARERARHARRGYPLASTGIAAYGYVPVIVTADGRVFADLGFGFEPITRACTFVATVQGPQGYTPPAYTPPAMITPTPLNPEEAGNRRAAEAAAARTAPSPAADSAARAAAPASCWARDAAGYVFIARQ